ncbi:MAG: ABC transporter permease [Bacteroidales bacterium]
MGYILLAFIRKELLQIRRNKMMLLVIFLIPVVQLVVLVFAANPIIKNIALLVVDSDESQISKDITNRCYSTGYFKRVDSYVNRSQAMATLERGDADVILEFPSFFERDILLGHSPSVMISADAVNGIKGVLAVNYLQESLLLSMKDLDLRFMVNANRESSQVELTYSEWYNPLRDHKSFMLPGILGMLLTVIAIMLSSVNIVREREKGNIEQINVTPISKVTFILGKVIPYGLIGLVQFTIGLAVIRFGFSVPIEGSVVLLYFVAIIYLSLLLSTGFLISELSENQSQAMFTTLFLIFIFVLMSGLLTPVESMPDWAQLINRANPLAYMVDIMRRVVLKGATMIDLWREILILVSFSISVNMIAIFNYRKSVD